MKLGTILESYIPIFIKVHNVAIQSLVQLSFVHLSKGTCTNSKYFQVLCTVKCIRMYPQVQVPIPIHGSTQHCVVIICHSTM